MSRLPLLLPIWMLLVVPLQAQDGLQVRGPEPEVVKLGESAQIELEWPGKEKLEVVMPEVQGLGFQLRGPSTSSSIQILGNRRIERFAQSWFVDVVPARSGEFVIPPIEVRIDGQAQRTRALRLRCVEDSVGKERAFVAGGSLPEQVYVHQPVDIWLQVGVDPELLQRLQRVDRRANTIGLLIEAPWWDEFPAGVPMGRNDGPLPANEPLIPINSILRVGSDLGERRREDRTYRVFEVRRRFLPNRPGAFTLDAPTLRFTWITRFVRTRFGDLQAAGEQKVFARGQVLNIRVLPLPEDGRPSDFRNAVGSFRLSHELSKSRLKVGETTRLTLRIEGDGNLEFLEVPAMDDLPGFHLFGKNVQRGEDRVVVDYDLAPLDDTRDAIPKIPFSWFDPHAEPPGYRRVELDPIGIDVRAVPGGGGLDPLPASTEALTPGVDDIWDRMPVEGPPPRPFRPSTTLIWVAMLTPLLVFGAGWAFARRRAWLRENPQLVRRRRALTSFHERLSVDGALKAFSVYLAERLGWDAAAAVRSDLEQRLQGAGVRPSLAAECAALMSRLAESRYAGGAGEESLRDETRALVERFDREGPR